MKLSTFILGLFGSNEVNARNLNRPVEHSLFPHLKTCGLITGTGGAIQEKVKLRLDI